MVMPNFFIVGAPKAGTDALFYALDQHPEIYMSPLKEPCYFSSEIRPENFHPSLQPQMRASLQSLRRYLDEGMPDKRFGGMVSDWDDYLRLFSHVNQEKAIGEGSVCYLWSSTAASAIASVIPHARIIIVLMDPAERAFHQYLKSISDGTVSHPFRKHLDLAMRAGPELGIYHPFLAFGNYATQVQRYMDNFPPHQLHISLYEDMQADYGQWFSSLLSFLGVENSFVPHEVEVPSTPHIPRLVKAGFLLRRSLRVVPDPFKTYAKRAIYLKKLPELDAEDRAALVRYYRDDILRLQGIIQRDLSAWLS
jgi:hypothetical protein